MDGHVSEEEDLDAILSEFQCQDLRAANKNNPTDAVDSAFSSGSSSLLFHSNLLLQGIDSREYDLDFSLRSMLGGGGAGGDGGDGTRGGQPQSSRKTFRKCLFVQPQAEWGRRPPSFVGGGLGMKLLTSSNVVATAKTDSVTDTDDNEKADDIRDAIDKNAVPWPYSEDTYIQTHPQYQAWYSFERSTTYTAKIDEYTNHVSNTGDINALAMYAADNPFLVEPLLQLAMFFFCTNDNERGMELLKRVLWIMESACVAGFMPLMVAGYTAGSPGGGKAAWEERHRVVVNFMDRGRDENAAFFSAIFRLMQTSAMMGCITTSLAAGRLLLSLDPMRDPMGVLMILDYFALATMEHKDLDFIVNLVEFKMVQIYYTDPQTSDNDSHCCELTDMPNWAFSYALALYRQSISAAEEHISQQLMEKANQQLHDCIRAFPQIPILILEKNNVDVTGRSFALDWPSVLEPLRKIDHNNVHGVEGDDTVEKYRAAIKCITQIFVQRGHKLWSGNDVLKWLYDACGTVTTSPEAQSQQDGDEPKTMFSPALTRYLQFDPSDFESTFHTLPADANPLDPALVDPVLRLQPNRRRMLRIPRQLGGGGGDGWRQNGRDQGENNDGIVVIDPDLPLLEIFWRSFLPWTRVRGVRPNVNR